MSATDPTVQRRSRAWRRERTWLSVELLAGFVMGCAVLFLFAFGPWLQTHDPYVGDLSERFLPVGAEGHLLGTDNLGRDLWSRLLEGLRWSISAAAMATALSFSIGTALGLAAANFGGFTRQAINQIVDTTLAFPSLIVAIVIVAVAGRGFWPLTLTLGLVTWPVFARVVYAEALSLLQRDYVAAAQLAGAPAWSILVGHVLPGLRPTLSVVVAFHFADMMIAESALSFLGLGAPLGVPTWGNLLQESRDYLFVAPWLLTVPALGIVTAVVTANLIGDGLIGVFRQRGKRIDI